MYLKCDSNRIKHFIDPQSRSFVLAHSRLICIYINIFNWETTQLSKSIGNRFNVLSFCIRLCYGRKKETRSRVEPLSCIHSICVELQKKSKLPTNNNKQTKKEYKSVHEKKEERAMEAVAVWKKSTHTHTDWVGCQSSHRHSSEMLTIVFVFISQ